MFWCHGVHEFDPNFANLYRCYRLAREIAVYCESEKNPIYLKKIPSIPESDKENEGNLRAIGCCVVIKSMPGFITRHDDR